MNRRKCLHTGRFPRAPVSVHVLSQPRVRSPRGARASRFMYARGPQSCGVNGCERAMPRSSGSVHYKGSDAVLPLMHT
jgi:hypothetical protein